MSAARAVRVGSRWRRNPPGREVVDVQRVWDSPIGERLVRAHPVRGGRPLVASVDHLLANYAPERTTP